MKNSADIVFASVGTNNIGGNRGVLQKDFEDLFKILKERKTVSAVCGILPRPSAGPHWNAHARSCNDWLKQMCIASSGIHFIDA